MRRMIADAPWPVVLLVASFLAPTELSLYLGGLRLPPHRVALLVLILPALWRLARGRDGLRVRAFDVLFAGYAAWTIGVFMHHQGQSEGLQFGGSLALESLGGYLVARVWIRDVATYRASMRLLVGAIAAAGLIALPEAVLGIHYVHDILRELTGYHHPIGHETRLGLTRAYGTFDHPIHLGTFCASVAALVWFNEPRLKEARRKVGIIAAATFMGLSSAPLLCFFLQVAFVGWDKLTRGVKGRFALTLVAVALLYAGLSLVMTRSPFMIVATGMVLDSWTGYYRMVIWEWGLINVWANPLAGLGLGDWERPWWMISASVDAFWLVITMRAGIPAFLLLVAAIVTMSVAVNRAGKRAPLAEMRQAALAWSMALIALSLVACTVHFWNVLHAYFFFFLGLAGWLADAQRVQAGRSSDRAHATGVADGRARRVGYWADPPEGLAAR